jgi:hypothetical protein
LEFTIGIKELKKNYKKRLVLRIHREWIAPHIPVSLSSTDYFSGEDKALHTIMEVIKAFE